MTDKFPSPLPERVLKQRIFGLDLARFTVLGDERAVVVTAERDQITLFWSLANGAWGSLPRTHDNLSLAPRRPDDTAGLGWSRRIGVAAAADQAALVYRRRFDASPASELYIDLYTFAPGDDAFSQGATRRFPREAFDIEAFGWSLWADTDGKELFIVAQAFSTDGPQLVLLHTAFPVSDRAALEDANNWRRVDLRAGGWDFDVRREGRRLVVLDRPVAESYAVDVTRPIDLAFGPVSVRLTENPTLGLPTLREMATGPMVRIDVDLATHTVKSVDETLPFGDNPLIHRIEPFVATVDRLHEGRFLIAPNQIRIRRLHAQRHLVMRTSRGWRTTPLLIERTNWPRTLSRFARNQQAVTIQPTGPRAVRVSWSSLWTLRPTALLKFAETEKGRLLTFAHQDPNLGALRATTFRVFDDSGGETLKAIPEAFAVLDLTHRHIPPPPEGAEPIEHQQLRPHRIEERATHADGFDVVRFEDSANTMNGVLVADAQRPQGFFAYTEMGDGGVRVVHDAKLDLPPPATPIDEKTFRPDWVAEPQQPGRAWVRLTSPDFIDAGLPGYFVAPTQMNAASLVCNQQRALDGLAFACDAIRASAPVSSAEPLTFAVPDGGDGRAHYTEAPNVLNPALIDLVSLTADSAREVQRFAVEQSEVVPLRPVLSRDDQPFQIEIRQPRSLRFANDTLEFEGFVVAAPDQDAFTFEWTFSDGTTATGRTVEHDFEPTQPDFSRVTPGEPADDIEVTLTVTAPDDRVSVATTTFPLARSLWAMLWTAYGSFRRAPDDALDENGDWQISEAEWETSLAPGMFVRDVTLSFYRYSIRYQVDEQGRGTRVDVSNRPVHDARFRFRANDAGQGDIEYEVPIRAQMTSVQLTGDFGSGLGNLIAIDSVDARLRARQRFTIGVQTSEQRNQFADSETMVERQILRDTELIPSALCCLPVADVTLEVDSPTVDAWLTAGGWTLAILVPAVVAALGTAGVLAILLPLLLIIAPVVVATAGVSVVVAALVGAGLGALAAVLIQLFVLRPYIRDRISEALERPTVRTSLRDSGLFDFAGEGLAESLARHLIRRAQADGHDVADPRDNGRERFRSPFFETIVVGEGECKAQVRV